MNLLPPLCEKIQLNGKKESTVSVLRLDLIHPLVGGNKIFKLKYNLVKAKELGYDTIATMGGAYSNHIVATAVAAKDAGFKSLGIIRGEPVIPYNKTLEVSVENGMELKFISRRQFDIYRNNFELVKQDFNKAFCIPEGGANAEGVKGCAEILESIKDDFDVVACAVGTGSTIAGLAISLKTHQQALGICVLKGAHNLDKQVATWVSRLKGNTEQFTINHKYHFGGYAKQDKDLKDFVQHFNANQPIQIEPIYTGKLFYALDDLINKNYFITGKRIIALHTGGLQYLG